MSDWKEYKLGDLIDVKHGFAFKGEFITPEPTEDILVTPGNFLIGGGFKSSKYKYYKGEYPQSYILNEGDVVITMTDLSQEGDSLGYAAKIPKHTGVRYLHNQRIGLVKMTSDKADKDFLHWVMRTSEYQGFIVGAASGTSIRHTSPTTIKEYEFSLPPLSVQKSIAYILTSLENKIDLLHRQNKTLERLADTIFRKWFVEDASDDWKETTFAEHSEVFRGLSYTGAGLANETDGVPMHNLNSVLEGGGYKYEGIKFYKGEFRERHKIATGDIIVANTEQGHEFRLIGFPAIVPLSFGESGIFSQHIYKLKVLESSYLTNYFFFYLIKSNKVREQIIGATNGSTVNMLAIDGLQTTIFQLPPKALVQKFTLLVKDYWKKMEDNRSQIKSLQTLRDNLLPKLMSGEAQVKN